MVTKAKQTKQYSMKSRDAFASLGSAAVERLLRKNKEKYSISSIINVEGDKKYQSDRNNQMMKLQEKMMYMGAGMQNFGQGLNDLGTAAAMQRGNKDKG